jgi:cytochrome b involved in lipid metabolism
VYVPTAAVGTYTMSAIAQHASSASCWLLVDGRVYDVTAYLRSHPGGSRTITPWCGKEATQAFATEGGRGEHSSNAYDLLADYEIGRLAA